jgi:hypothetical protein
MEFLNAFLETLNRFWMQVTTFLPQFTAAVCLTFAGWFLAKVLRKGLLRLFRGVHVDELAEKIGLDDFLLQGGVEYTASTLLANLGYWFIIITVFLAVINSLGLQASADLFSKIVLYIPNVIIAIIVLMFGTLLAKFIRGIVLAYLNNLGISGAEVVGIVAQWAILIFVISMALEQLAIGGQVLVSAFQIAFGALCLALALAFGLGGRDWAAHMLERIWKKNT